MENNNKKIWECDGKGGPCYSTSDERHAKRKDAYVLAKIEGETVMTKELILTCTSRFEKVLEHVFTTCISCERVEVTKLEKLAVGSHALVKYSFKIHEITEEEYKKGRILIDSLMETVLMRTHNGKGSKFAIEVVDEV